MKLKLILLSCIFALCYNALKAQDAPPTVKELPTQTFTPSHIKAAQRVLEASGILENMQKVFATAIQNQAMQIPEDKRAVFVGVMAKFFAKYINDEEVENAFVPIYAAEFSEQELNQIADFMLTPAGKDMVAKQPELMNKGMQWGQKVVQDHQQDLQAMMKDAMGDK